MFDGAVETQRWFAENERKQRRQRGFDAVRGSVVSESSQFAFLPPGLRLWCQVCVSEGESLSL